MFYLNIKSSDIIAGKCLLEIFYLNSLFLRQTGENDKVNFMKKYYLLIGQVSLIGSLVLIQFAEKSGIVPYAIGILSGLAVIFNTAYMIQRRQNNQDS